MVCDANPVVGGHILIIPKSHLSCIGEYSKNLFKEFLNLYKKVSEFLLKAYGSVSTFEHGKL
ncbi:HIT domain-containing protein [Patescibacteria group bacterium]|nr:HIT domain-containing protein [Patescibacteria group bacterium]